MSRRSLRYSGAFELANHQKNLSKQTPSWRAKSKRSNSAATATPVKSPCSCSDRSQIASNRYAKQSLELNERTHGNNSVLNIAPLTVLADQAMHNGDLNSAELYALRAVKVAESNDNDTKHIGLIKPLTELARIYRKEKEILRIGSSLSCAQLTW